MEFVSFFGGGKEAPADGKDRPVRLGVAEPAPYVPAPTAADIGGGGAGKSSLKDDAPADTTGGDAAKQSKATAENIRSQWQAGKKASEAQAYRASVATDNAVAEAAFRDPPSSAPGAQASASSAALGSRISSALASKPAASPAPAKGGMGMSQ